MGVGLHGTGWVMGLGVRAMRWGGWVTFSGFGLLARSVVCASRGCGSRKTLEDNTQAIKMVDFFLIIALMVSDYIQGSFMPTIRFIC